MVWTRRPAGGSNDQESGWQIAQIAEDLEDTPARPDRGRAPTKGRQRMRLAGQLPREGSTPRRRAWSTTSARCCSRPSATAASATRIVQAAGPLLRPGRRAPATGGRDEPPRADRDLRGRIARRASRRRRPRQLDHALSSDLFRCSIANRTFNLLWLNPPYDWDRENKRVEQAFLTHTTRYLEPDGVLVYVIPRAQVATSARFLTTNYRRVRAWSFPEPEGRGVRPGRGAGRAQAAAAGPTRARCRTSSPASTLCRR